jgi:hypothetical protein
VFGQQYRFVAQPDVQLRLGAPRCGGLVVTLNFRDGER